MRASWTGTWLPAHNPADRGRWGPLGLALTGCLQKGRPFLMMRPFMFFADRLDAAAAWPRGCSICALNGGVVPAPRRRAGRVRVARALGAPPRCHRGPEAGGCPSNPSWALAHSAWARHAGRQRAGSHPNWTVADELRSPQDDPSVSIQRSSRRLGSTAHTTGGVTRWSCQRGRHLGVA